MAALPPGRRRSRRGSSSSCSSNRSRSRSGSRSRAPEYRIVGVEEVESPGKPKNKITPQAAIDEFWAKFTSKTPGKATTVIPSDQFVKNQINRSITIASPGAAATANTTSDEKDKLAPSAADLVAYAVPVNSSYEAAATICRAKVDKIIKECRRVNKKYRDAHFDIETDLKIGVRDCLESLSNVKDADAPPGRSFQPQGVKRVTDIFDDPKFYIDGPTANDVRQGRDGDCWLMSALCTLSNKPGMIERLCVAHDEDVGVYGFVFHRDGEWISEIVDDFLYLTKSDYDESFYDRVLFDELERVNAEELYRKVYQSNSGALYFAQCSHQQETWLPLLEKCYAKAHGDFAAIEGGFGGEGIEDMTGGITSEIFTTDILDKELFWKELLSANKEFLFSCGTGVWGAKWGERGGIIELHSYSVQKAVEIDGKRLVRLKNPWGKGEWKGAWSDGSKEWTPEWLQKLGHRFGDDGDFWIEYRDLLRKYQSFERTRLFEGDWKVAQLWTTLNVPWMVAYHDTYFSFKLAQSGRVVIQLAQLDERYFRGLEGQYGFQLSFRVHKTGHEDYLVRSQLHQRLRRSLSVELDLEEGEYDVRVKFNSYRDHSRMPIEDVIRKNAKDNRDKLTCIGLAYDLAHSKGQVVQTAEEKAAMEAREKKDKGKRKDEIKKDIREKKEVEYYMRTKEFQRGRRRELKRRQKRREKIAQRKAERKAKKAAEMEAKGVAADETKDGDAKVDELKKDDTKDGDANAEELKKNDAKDGDSNAPEVKKEEPKKDDVNVADSKTDNADAAKEEQVDDGWETQPEDNETPQKKHDKKSKKHHKQNEADETPTESDATPDHEDASTQCESDDDNDDDLESLDSMSVYSDRELDIRASSILTRLEENDSGSDADSNDGEPDEFESDPWNAVAVVGLRVYHQATPGQETDNNVIALRVVRPNQFGDDQAGDAAKSKTQGLDVDDSSKDATLTGEVGDRKKNIMGERRKPR